MKEIKNRYKLIGGFIIGLLLITFITGYPTIEKNRQTGEWVTDWAGSLADLVSADYNPGAGDTGPLWIAGIDAATNIDTWANTNRSYATVAALPECVFAADTDNFNIEIENSNDFNFAIKVRANDTIYHDGAWNDSRIRVTLTVSGDLDQTITAVTEYNNSASAGDLNKCGTVGTTWAYYVAYWTVGADDYDLDEGGTATISLIKVETYRTN